MREDRLHRLAAPVEHLDRGVQPVDIAAKPGVKFMKFTVSSESRQADRGRPES